MVIPPRTTTHAEFAGAMGITDLRSIEMRLFMHMTKDGIDLDIVDEDEDEETAVTMSIRVPDSFNSGVGYATLRQSSNHGDVCRITGSNPHIGDITMMEFRMRRGHIIVLAFTRDEIFNLMKGVNYIYAHRDEWAEYGEVRGAWLTDWRKREPAPLPLAA